MNRAQKDDSLCTLCFPESWPSSLHLSKLKDAGSSRTVCSRNYLLAAIMTCMGWLAVCRTLFISFFLSKPQFCHLQSGCNDNNNTVKSHLSKGFSSVTQLCPTLCDPIDWSMPGLPVHYQLLELTQTHVHQVTNAIQLSHPSLSPSPAFNLSQHQGLFQWVSSSHKVAKVLELQLQHQSFQWIFMVDLP